MFQTRYVANILLGGAALFASAGALLLGGLGYYLGYSQGASAVLESTGSGLGVYARHAAERYAALGERAEANSVAEEQTTVAEGEAIALSEPMYPNASFVCAFMPCASQVE